MRVILILAS